MICVTAFVVPPRQPPRNDHPAARVPQTFPQQPTAARSSSNHQLKPPTRYSSLPLDTFPVHHQSAMHHKPSIVVHGGAGSISRANLPPDSPAYTAYTSSLRNILKAGHRHLRETNCALETAVHVVALFEDNPLFNCGKGSVFNRAGKVECEASLMVCDVKDGVREGRGREKRGVGVAMLRRTKNPIKLAKEVLLRWGDDVQAGAGRHGFLSGEEVERLGEVWGCEMAEEGYFWTERRWKEVRARSPRASSCFRVLSILEPRSAWRMPGFRCSCVRKTCAKCAPAQQLALRTWKRTRAASFPLLLSRIQAW